MRRLFLLAVLLVAVPTHADTIMINNGLAPPTPANVIDYFTLDNVYVRNVGCPPGWPSVFPTDPCPSPGAPTEVVVVDGGFVPWLFAHDSSAITMTGGRVWTLTTPPQSR
jgi:hypothetical protein